MVYGALGGVAGAAMLAARLTPVEPACGEQDSTRFVVFELACVVSVEEVDTDDGGVKTGVPVLSIVRPRLGGLCWMRG